MSGDVGAYLERYVRSLKEMGAIRSEAVELAFRKVQRHRLVETFHCWEPDPPWGDLREVRHKPEDPKPEDLEVIYSDRALAILLAEGRPVSSTSQPSLMAQMLELLELEPGVKVLEIGTGAGYNAALMAEIVEDQNLVVTMDVLEEVVGRARRLLAGAGYPNLRVVLRDGFEGFPEEGPFDRIVATVGCSDLSPHWAEQFAPDGRMLVPLEHAGGHPLLAVWREDDVLKGRVQAWSGFIPVSGPLLIETLWAQGIATTGPGEPGAAPGVQERPAWPGFGTGPPVPGSDCREDELDFLFYVGLRDRRACWGPPGVGLSEGMKGWAVVGRGKVRWFGDPSLVDELGRLHADWVGLGRPSMREYEMAFVLLDGERRGSPNGRWNIDRRFFRQVVWL